jgi:cellobiose phosphorylase
MYRISFDYILGIRPTYSGLLVDPSIPSDWKGFLVERVYRGTKYIIDVENPHGLEHGRVKLCVDGQEIEGNTLPVSEQKICRVTAVMNKE